MRKRLGRRLRDHLKQPAECHQRDRTTGKNGVNQQIAHCPACSSARPTSVSIFERHSFTTLSGARPMRVGRRFYGQRIAIKELGVWEA